MSSTSTQPNSVRTSIVGASGYTGEELCKVLLKHPYSQLKVVTSRQRAGKQLSEEISGLHGKTDLLFSNPTPQDLAGLADVFFLALPHGVASEYAVPLFQAGKIVIDLSADFRLKSPEVYQEFYQHPHPAPALLKESIYALPELHRKEIRSKSLLASPGCYPTSIILALFPALKNQLLQTDSIVVNSLSGVSGAGKKVEESLLFCEVNETAKAYGVPRHRHLSEIEQELSLMAGNTVKITFIPHLIPLHRGMWSSITCKLSQSKSIEDIYALYQSTYANEPFVRVLPLDKMPDMRNVVRSNRIEIGLRWDARTERLMIFSTIDNLGKGAATQAIQSFNIRLGFPETTGLE
ncbi:MAG: N-acetyl-gamma-glutamyl-phosphate reductase [Verrucomicrobiota bacterium]